MIPVLPALLANTSLTAVASNSIPAVVYDGVQGYLKHTGGPAGAADGAELSFAWSGTFNSDGSAMTLLDIPGTVPVKLSRGSDNTITFAGGTTGAVFSNVTTAVAASLGFLIILASCNGTSSTLKVVHAAGTITGTNTPGSATNLDLTADWFLGADGGASEFLDADTALWWINNAEIDFTVADNIEQFWDTTADKLRDPGATGANPLDGASSPLVCHKSAAASHVTNAGTGGDADTAGTFTDGTSPGTYAADFVGRDGLDVLGEAAGWIEADDVSNTVVSTAFSQLTDLTGNGNHFVQATAGNRPAQATGGGLTWAEFDGNPSGGDDFMFLDAPTAAYANAHNAGGTTIAVFRADSRGEGGFGAVFRVGAIERLQVDSPGVPHDVFRTAYAPDMSTTDPFFQTSSGTANGTLILAEFYYDKSGNDPSTAKMFVNGVELTTSSGLNSTTSAGSPVDDSASDAYLGNSSANNRTFDGGIYMLARWNSILADADKLLVRNHLATKYGITLP